MLNPGEVESYAWLANVLSYVGRSAEALEQLSHPRQLDLLHPPLWDFYIGRALLHVGHDQEALAWLERCARRAVTFGHWQRYMAAALAHLGGWQRRARARLQAPTATRVYGSISEIRRDKTLYINGIEFDRLIEPCQSRSSRVMLGTTTSQKTQDRRKLIAVVYADMVGYSRLIGLDDPGDAPTAARPT